jgi:hypothetical protein
MLDLLHALARDLNLSLRRLLRLFDERVQHHHAAPYESTKEDSCDAFLTLEAQLKKPVAEGVCMRRTEIRAYCHDSPGQHHVPCRERVREREDLFSHGIAVVLDGVVPQAMITNMLSDLQPGD